MSVSNQTPFNTYNATGVAKVFPYQFLLLDADDLTVTLDGVALVYGTAYTVTGLGEPAGGDVVFAAAPTGKVLIKRVLTIQRLTDYQDNGDLLAESLNNDLDRLWQALQQLQQNDLRAIKLPFDTTTDQEIPDDAAARANLLVGFDASGNVDLKTFADLSSVPVSSFIATLLDDANAAAARATLGIVPASTNGADLDPNSVPLSRIARGTVGKVLLGNGPGADASWGDAPFSVSMIPAASLTRAKLSNTVVAKFKGFPSRQDGELPYAGMLVKMDDDTLMAWGRTGNLALGLNETGDTTSFARKPVFNVAIPDGVTVKDFIMTGGSSYVLLSNGWVYSSGNNASGQLGHGDTTARSIFTRIEYFVTNSITVDKIFAAGAAAAVSYVSAYFLNAAGNVWSCGINTYGQLGVGDTTNRNTPTAISGAISGVTDVKIGGAYYSHTLILTSGGSIYGAGYNAQGQLGAGDTTNRSSFTAATGITGVSAIAVTAGAAGAGHSLALRTNGDVYSCGYNGQGQLGQGDTSNRTGFTKISSLSGISSIGAAGGYYGYSWAVSSVGRLYTWGDNSQGAIGDGSTVDRTSPFNVVGWSGSTVTDPPFVGKIAKVLSHYSAETYQHLVVLDTDGGLWLSGWDYGFYCGDTAASKTRFTPFLPFKLDGSAEKVTDIFLHGTVGTYRHFLISDDSKLYAIGDNGYGVCQAGVSATPAFVKSPQKVRL